MPRRNDHTPEELRKMVLDASEGILVRQGVKGLTARSIATAIGYAPGTLYNLFPTISDIALAVLARNLERLNALLRLDAGEIDPRRRLHRFADVYLAYVHDNSVSWQALFDYRREHPGESTPEWYTDHIVALTRIVAKCFADLDELGADPQDCADRAVLLWSGIYGLTLLDAERRFDAIVGGDLSVRVHAQVDIALAAWAARPLKKDEAR